MAAGAGVQVGLLETSKERSLFDPHNPAATPYAVFCGLDVAKSDHHACALDPVGTRLHDKELPNDETAMRTVFERLRVHGARSW